MGSRRDVSTAGSGMLARFHRVLIMVFRHQHSGNIYFTTADMCMNIDTTSHYNFIININGLINSDLSCRLPDDPAITYENVSSLSPYPVRGVINNSAFYSCQHSINITLKEYYIVCLIFSNTLLASGNCLSLRHARGKVTTLSVRIRLPT